MNRFLSRSPGADANAGTRGLVFAPLSRDDGFAAVFAGGTRSPMHGGFLVLSAVFDERVREVAGGAAFETDEDDEPCLRVPWSSAKDALLDAAMALDAPAPATGADRRILLAAWEDCSGRE